MRIEGKKNGKVTSGTVRKQNFKNQQVLGKKVIKMMEDSGAKGALKKNFHKNIGGNKRDKHTGKALYMSTHDEIAEQLHEIEADDYEFQKQNGMHDSKYQASKDEKQSYRLMRSMMQESH